MTSGIPIVETQAGKGSLSWDHDQNLGAVGVTGTSAANLIAQRSDLVICIGTRLSDFTTASKTLFKNPDVMFLSINVSSFDAHKHSSLSLIGDAKACLEDFHKMITKTSGNLWNKVISRCELSDRAINTYRGAFSDKNGSMDPWISTSY